MHCHELNSTEKTTISPISSNWRLLALAIPHPKTHFHRWKLCTFVGKECIFPPHQGKKRRRWNLQFSNGKFINGKYVKGIIKHIALHMMRLIRSITSSCYKWWWITNWEPGRNDMMPPRPLHNGKRIRCTTAFFQTIPECEVIHLQLHSPSIHFQVNGKNSHANQIYLSPVKVLNRIKFIGD